MNLPRIRKLQPALTKFLKRFDHGFPRNDTRAHLPVSVSGPLSDIPEKSVAPIARNAGVPPRTLQAFLSQHHWDHDLWRDDLEGVVRDDHSGPHSVGIIDETSDVKQGDKTPGVPRPWCGSVGTTENGIVTVHLAYARDGFHCLLDGELDRPKSWSDDRGRCRAAGIPDDRVYRPPWKIALGLDDHAVAHGPHFDGLTFDEGYAGKPERPRERSGRGQKFVAEVPRHVTGGVKAPRVVTRPFHQHGRGRGRKTPRRASGSPPPRRVDARLDRDGFRHQPWVKWRVKDGPKGPIVWEVKHPRFFAVGADGCRASRRA
jgi:DDE superfamily endonuclease